MKNILMPLGFMFASLAAFVALGPISCKTDSQEMRQNYCNNVLEPEVCDLLIERGEFAEFPTEKARDQACKTKFGPQFCSLPITSSLHDMRKCVDDLRHITYLSPTCLELTHGKK